MQVFGNIIADKKLQTDFDEDCHILQSSCCLILFTIMRIYGSTYKTSTQRFINVLLILWLFLNEQF